MHIRLGFHAVKPALVTIWTFRDHPDALLAKAKLESAGIECFLSNENMVALYWLYSNLTGGIGLQVDPDQAEAALAILQQPIPDTISFTPLQTGGDYQQPKCPQCGSLRIEHLGLDKFITFGSWLMLGFPIRLAADSWHCDACGNNWQSTSESDADRSMISSEATSRILIATSNKGKIADFAAIARDTAFSIETVPDFSRFKPVEEDGSTFEQNAIKKAQIYSSHLPNELVIADDSGLEVDALEGAPGVLSARYAATSQNHKPSDSANNYKLIYELGKLASLPRTARFVCVIALARDGNVLATFRGEARGEILQMPVGKHGFGYDPLFFVAEANKTFAEMDATEKGCYSHRGKAFRKCLDWMKR